MSRRTRAAVTEPGADGPDYVEGHWERYASGEPPADGCACAACENSRGIADMERFWAAKHGVVAVISGSVR